MFVSLRALAPVVLLVASMLGHVVTGGILVHLTVDHARTPVHDGYHDVHHGEEAGEHEDADHGPEHTNDLVPTAPTAHARIACTQLSLPLLVAVVEDRRIGLLCEHAVRFVAPPDQRAATSHPQRHTILLI